MISDKAALSTRVGWIKAEIDVLLEQSRQALETYQSRDRNAESLQQCYNALALVNKSLNLAGIKGGKTLSDEMLALLTALKHDDVQDHDASMEILAQSFLQLNEYLQHVEAGYADLPVVLLPLINELRAARGEELLSEMFVFLPGEDEIDNSHIGNDDVHELDGDLQQSAYKQIRYHFQRALVSWYKGEDAEKSLKNLQLLSGNLIKVHHDIDERKLWWATDALAQAIEENKLEDGVAVKLLLGNMERHIGHLMYADDPRGTEAEQSELNRNILYYIGLAKRGSKKADRIKDAYMLDIYLPQGDNLERMRQHYSSPGQELWSAVANSVNEDVDVIIEGIKSLGMNPDANTVDLLVSKGEKISTTISMIGMGSLTAIVDSQVKILKPYHAAPEQLTDNIRTDLSSKWMGVKAVLDEYAQSGKDTTDTVFSDHDKVSAGELDAIKEVYQTVNDELANTLNSINHFEKDRDISHLSVARGSLISVKSTMTFMDNKELSPMIDGVIAYMDDIIISGESNVDSDELVTLADVLMVLDAATSALQENEDHTVLLEKGYQSLEKLGRFTELDEKLRKEIANAREMTLEIKKQMRQSRMQTMLAV